MQPIIRSLPYIFFKRVFIPPYLIHFVTNRCNARCKHCFINFNADVSDKRYYCASELSTEEIDKFTYSLRKKLIHVNLTGGEVFLRDDIPQIVRSYVKNAGVSSAVLLTNGYFTKRIEGFVDKILTENSRLILAIGVSLDDIDERHDQFRRCQHLFKHAKETILSLKKIDCSRFSWHINMCVTKENHQRLNQIHQGFIELFGDFNLNFGLVRDENINQSVLDNYKKFIWLTEQKKVLAYNRRKGLFGIDIINARNRLLHHEVISVVKGKRYRAPCVAGQLACVLYAGGEIYPCEIIDRPLGNIRDYHYDLAKILKDKKTKEVVDSIRKTKCSCIHGCFLGMTILYSVKYYPLMLKEWLKIKFNK